MRFIYYWGLFTEASKVYLLFKETVHLFKMH